MSKAGKIVKITVKTLLLGISFCIYAFFIFRLCSTGEAPKSITKIVWNETAREAYLADPESFCIYSQTPDTYITNDGRFWISDIIYLPQAKQLQMTIKYNDSTLKYLRESLGDPAMVLPAEPFDYSLLSSAGVRLHEYSSDALEYQNYNYRRLVFENVVIEDKTSHYVDIYYVDSINYSAIPYGSLLVWNTALPVETLNVRKYLPDDLK